MTRGPIPNVVGLLESHGVVVTRLPLASTDVDAFSLPFSDRPIVVLGAEKNDRARSRFDAAHELGHLVMHGEQLWGLPEVERQAHRFAAAFLMPRRDIADQLPDRTDWPRFFSLKRQWQVSLAALLMRARALGRMAEGDYLTAVKAASARGWRRVEPVPLGRPEQPQLLQALLQAPSGRDCRNLLPKYVVDALEIAVAG
jgi:Zn-dependent peptidase ImmA (M78 family)